MPSSRNYPAIQEPLADVNALYATVKALKEVVELLSGQRDAREDTAVTWRDLDAFNLGSGYPVYSADGVTLDLTLGVFSVHPAYVGQSSITTLGTIATGVWQGTPIAVGFGGTGVSAASGQALDNITGFSSTGLLARTAAATYAFRSLAGTASRVSVSNGSGVAGNPTVDIDAAYVGQASITTLGTIVTGTWSATTVGAAYGGTGQATYTVGDILYASGATALSKLAGVATGNALISGGVGTAPSWGKIGLTTHVTGSLGLANGGTGGTDAATARTNLGLGTAAVENIGTSGANVPRMNAANTWSALQTIAPGSNTTNFLSAGLTRGVRITHDATRTRLDGVDNTGAASYQPLGINGSQVDFFTSLTIRGTLSSTLMDWLLPLRGVSLATAIATLAANTTLNDTHGTVLVNGTYTITLPAPAAGNTGRIYIVKLIASASTVTVDVSGGANIDGAASTTITVQYAYLRFQSNGTQWYTV